MSWSVSTKGPVDHARADGAIDELQPDHESHAEQLEAAKKAAHALVKGLPKGGSVHVALSGHKDEGAQAYISASVQHYAAGA